MRETEEDLSAAARLRVAASFEAALAWAQAQTDPETRTRALFAVVRAWAEIDPIAAVRWALERPSPTTENFMEAALQGAAAKPAMALAIGRLLLASDPEMAATYGQMLVEALSRVKQFGSVLELAKEAPLELRQEWLGTAFHLWGAENPTEALQAMSLLDESVREPVFRALAAGWGRVAPGALTAFLREAESFPRRELVFNAAVEAWALQDPAALGTWLNTLPPGDDFDRGAVALLRTTDQANRSVEIALRWVEAISDRQLRRESLRRVLSDWQRSEPDAAQNYILRVPWLSGEERAELTQSLSAGRRGEAES